MERLELVDHASPIQLVSLLVAYKHVTSFPAIQVYWLTIRMHVIKLRL